MKTKLLWIVGILAFILGPILMIKALSLVGGDAKRIALYSFSATMCLLNPFLLKDMGKDGPVSGRDLVIIGMSLWVGIPAFMCAFVLYQGYFMITVVIGIFLTIASCLWYGRSALFQPRLPKE